MTNLIATNDEIAIVDQLYFLESYQELYADLHHVVPDIPEVLAELVEKSWVQQMKWSTETNDFVKKDPPDLQQLDQFHYLATKEGLLAVNTR